MNGAAESNVGVGFIPILQGFKGDPFLPILGRDRGDLSLENGDKPHPDIGGNSKRPTYNQKKNR
jgi:hypothetical protein